MTLYEVLGLLNAKANLVVRVSLFVYTSILERLEGRVHSFNFKQQEYGNSSVYPFTLLRLYDRLLDWNNYTCWNVKSSELQAFFDASISKHHLDIGVGSGRFLATSKRLKALCEEGGAKVELWDLNNTSLVYASQRIKRVCGDRLEITTRQVDICDRSGQVEPTESLKQDFTSVTMCYLFHCIPYSTKTDASNQQLAIEKFQAGFENVAKVMARGAILSGTTIISCDDPDISPHYSKLRIAMARSVMIDLQEKLGHFHNQYDTLNAIEEGAKLAGLEKKATFIKGLVAHFVFEKT